MNKRQAYNMGKERGYNVASWVDLPELGARVDKSLDYQGLGERVTSENVADYFTMLAQDAETIDRDYSPFEFTASDFNSQPNSESLWDEFDRGIEKGISDNWKERRDYYK
jgi:hypothetical protein